MAESSQRKGTLAELMGLKSGIRCPSCGAAGEFSVHYTRKIADGVRRVRICRHCGHRVVTVERASGGSMPSAGK